MKPLLALAIAGAMMALAAVLGSCTPQQQASTRTEIAGVSAGLQSACATAMGLAPLAGPYSIYIVAGCGTAEGLAKLASDPTSQAWVEGLIAKVRALLQAQQKLSLEEQLNAHSLGLARQQAYLTELWLREAL